MRIIGIIPARGGSKSIPRKNIKDLAGKPLIAWTVEAAKASGVLDRLILTTDDAEIAEVGKRLGVEVPFMRPAELALDTSPTLLALQHAVSWLKENENYYPDAVMLLQPTGPLRQPRHICEAIEVFKKTGADSVVSVVDIPGHFSSYWAVVEGADGRATLFNGEPIHKRIPRRQDFPRKTYAHNGAIYLFKTELLFLPEKPSLYGEHVRLYPMEQKYSVNIDHPEDWVLAEWTINNLLN
ncbi:MAG: acylneuraminate cytidylyltransferase family protein [bacterium]|nr:acylneuraminate cytidylyltransferase family protein [bacterium]